MTQARALLLDTHAAIWLAAGTLSAPVVDQIAFAGLAEGVFVSPVSAWEIGLLARPRADGSPGLTFKPDPATWFGTLISKSIIKEAPFDWRMALASTTLPESFHKDPADRFLVATAREMDIPILTSDRNILAYAAAGHVQAMPC